MKVLVVFLALAVLMVSAGHYELCGFDDMKLAKVTVCIEIKASLRLKLALSRARVEVNCLINDVCLFRTLCAKGDLGEVLKSYMTDALIEELHEIAEDCEK